LPASILSGMQCKTSRKYLFGNTEIRHLPRTRAHTHSACTSVLKAWYMIKYREPWSLKTWQVRTLKKYAVVFWMKRSSWKWQAISRTSQGLNYIYSDASIRVIYRIEIRMNQVWGNSDTFRPICTYKGWLLCSYF